MGPLAVAWTRNARRQELMLITFSGLDGAGKSTLIAALAAKFPSQDVRVLTMYDDLTLFSCVRKLRDGARRRVLGMAGRVPGAPPSVDVDDKGNVSRADTRTAGIVYVVTRRILLRQIAYLFDVIISRAIIGSHLFRARVVIVDRYFYDSMVDIAAAERGKWFYSVEEARQIRPPRRAYMKFVLRMARKPDLPIFIDVDPAEAYRRKPEYPLAYSSARRVVYSTIFREWLDHGTVVENRDVSAALAEVEAGVARCVAAEQVHAV